MSLGEQKQKFRIHDNPAVVEVYANKVVGTAFDGGAVTITLGTVRFAPNNTDEGRQPGQHRSLYVTQRIALSRSAAIELMNSLNKLMAMLTQAQATQQAPQQSH